MFLLDPFRRQGYPNAPMRSRILLWVLGFWWYVLSGGWAQAAQPFQEAGGQVVIEAEHFETAVARNGQAWTLGTSQSGFAGSGYMEALPNSGTTRNTGYLTTSPELIFQVQFATPGTYSVWLRGSAANGNDDSAHAGLDGAGPAESPRAP